MGQGVHDGRGRFSAITRFLPESVPVLVQSAGTVSDIRTPHCFALTGGLVDLKVQQELLRHSDIRTTMNIYTQAVSDAMREAQQSS